MDILYDAIIERRKEGFPYICLLCLRGLKEGEVCECESEQDSNGSD